MRYKETLLDLAKRRIANLDGPIVDINLLQIGEAAVIKLYQNGAFQKEISTLENGRAISSQSMAFKLNPFLKNDRMLSVGGRINKGNLDYRLNHPVLLPKIGYIMHTIIRDYHEKIAYVG